MKKIGKMFDCWSAIKIVITMIVIFAVQLCLQTCIQNPDGAPVACGMVFVFSPFFLSVISTRPLEWAMGDAAYLLLLYIRLVKASNAWAELTTLLFALILVVYQCLILFALWLSEQRSARQQKESTQDAKK